MVQRVGSPVLWFGQCASVQSVLSVSLLRLQPGSLQRLSARPSLPLPLAFALPAWSAYHCHPLSPFPSVRTPNNPQLQHPGSPTQPILIPRPPFLSHFHSLLFNLPNTSCWRDEIRSPDGIFDTGQKSRSFLGQRNPPASPVQSGRRRPQLRRLLCPLSTCCASDLDLATDPTMR
ncbi:hypothetical protein B0H63DRAFT_276836 [Podospora didyma]|uniref:Uncharacterized protein n=1 Tax=Podospora didyma TaxID=330526 RepID=A0AAE0N939_9PEZI|nr:hypothetical protein B0H63DRAFT_276836 [Podospora didyma]